MGDYKKQKKTLKKGMALFLAAAVVTGTAACGNGGQKQGGKKADAVSYEITEENENLELTMTRQPESSYWFPAELLEWKAEEDPDLAYNISAVPLAKRAEMDALTAVNETQNKETQIMAISIMNSSTSGNAPRGLNKSNSNTFSYWQYVDTLVYWGGSSGEGLIVAPSPDVVDAGHKNGVKVIGTIFFPQAAHGGKMQWLDEFLAKDADGNFPIVDKLIEVASTYGFDGWFMNQESEGSEEEPLTKEHADLMQELIAAYKVKAPELQMIYYDSMTKEGKMDWQNALTDENIPYLKTGADSMFLNFWWTGDTLADQELLKASMEKAQENGIDPYSLYAGVDIQSEGYLTPIRWDLFENGAGGTYTSLGIYCPNWAYSSASDMEDFWKKEGAVWVNSKADPFEAVEYSSNTQWKGISTYAIERTAITELPFITNFNMGNGYSFFKDGEQISKLDWNNRSISDIMPTYRWHIEQEENTLAANLDVGNAYYGGNSIKLRGDMKKGKTSDLLLYSADLPIPEGTVFTTTVKANAETSLDAVVILDDGSEQVLKGDKKAKEDWTTIHYKTKELAGKSIRRLSYRISAGEDKSGYEIYFGNISITDGKEMDKTTVSGLTVEDIEFDEDAMYAGVRLKWEADVPAAYYEVYRVNENKSKSLLGVTNTTNFYVNTLPRTDETNKSIFSIVPVNGLLEEGTGMEVTAEWPDNSLPKSEFAADQTLIAPGETVTFTSLCSANTEEYEWSFPGADTESDSSESPAITYSKEGVYDVTLTAKNGSGTADKEKKAYIVVSKEAAEGTVLLSQGAATEASAYVNENEAPQFAVDGDVTKKWCATGTAPHELVIDLGELQTVSAVDISHAEAGGESPDMNTKSYTISVSEDGTNYVEVASITRNTLAVTHDTFAPTAARYIKLSVVKPTQGSDSAARIYEVQVYGLKKPL